MYQRIGKAAYKADLSNTWRLMDYLDHPEMGFKSVHLAGTNGKGSTSHLLASVLQEAGYTVGLYTSPHLKDFRERIKINGEMIPKRTVSSFVARHKVYFETNELSFFEMTVGLAFDYFKNKKVDIAIVEVGLGGRLDSTNVLIPAVSVITNIGLDHTQFLGTTLQQIAAEKAGIMKRDVPVIIGEQTAETRPVFEEKAKEEGARLLFAQEQEVPKLSSDLLGDYQKHNKRTAWVALQELNRLGWKVSDNAIKSGFQHVVKNTGLLGRWQQLNEVPRVICDTAHNKEGLSYTMKQLNKIEVKQLHVVLGVVSDKDLMAILPLFPKDAKYYFCAPKISRAMDAQVLQREALSYGLKGEVYVSVKGAYKVALKEAETEDLIYVGGSTFVVGEVL